MFAPQTFSTLLPSRVSSFYWRRTLTWNGLALIIDSFLVSKLFLLPLYCRTSLVFDGANSFVGLLLSSSTLMCPSYSPISLSTYYISSLDSLPFFFAVSQVRSITHEMSHVHSTDPVCISGSIWFRLGCSAYTGLRVAGCHSELGLRVKVSLPVIMCICFCLFILIFFKANVFVR